MIEFTKMREGHGRMERMLKMFLIVFGCILGGLILIGILSIYSGPVGEEEGQVFFQGAGAVSDEIRV
ncbi:hypothetical protein JSY36_18105 [Bacillus sp. H-16]|uniref:hypothetical protein n=1 Tax=Alteribacter salitolerans TaxID=2912333 RepID=UPI001963028A|nr:hypothetical protein [Alteribacter salitolerans]MBM7097652.1 hypothetical protein [Alteribacter salitolerans]